MCRLFGYRGKEQRSLQHPLIKDERSLCALSEEHRDGWGIAYFQDGVPHVTRSVSRAGVDSDFVNLAKILSSPLVIAHLRRATQGEISLLNCHPFQYGRWVFAHNGDLPDFTALREKFRTTISPSILTHVRGDTDSEVYFAIFQDELRRTKSHRSSMVSLVDSAGALRRAIKRIMDVYADEASDKPFALNVIVADGNNFLAYRHGHSLYYKKIGENIFVCSEPHRQDDGYVEMYEGQMIGSDHKFKFYVNL